MITPEIARSAGELLYLLAAKVPRGNVTLWFDNSLYIARYEWVFSYAKHCAGVQYAVGRDILESNAGIQTISCHIIGEWIKRALKQLPDGVKL